MKGLRDWMRLEGTTGLVERLNTRVEEAHRLPENGYK